MTIPGVGFDSEVPEFSIPQERPVGEFNGQLFAFMAPPIQDGTPMPEVKVQIDEAVHVVPGKCPSIPMLNTAPRLPLTEMVFAVRLSSSGKTTEPEIECGPVAAFHPQTSTVLVSTASARTEVPVHSPLRSETPQSETPVRRIESLMEVAKALTPRQIGVRVEPLAAHPIDLYFEQRGRDLHLSVHTADGSLANEMRSSLGELSVKLVDQGFRTETWTPAALTPVHAAVETKSTQEQFSQPEDRRASQDYPQQQQERRDRRRPQWLIEFEKRLFAPGAKSGRLI